MLVKETLKAELVQLQKDMLEETDQAAAQANYAEKLAAAIDNYIKSATVTVNFPIPVTVVPATGVGGTTATGTGTIS